MGVETRETSATGGQKGVKLERYDLVPVMPLRQLAVLYGKGVIKYSENNWRNGYEWKKSIASLMRHFEAWREGKEYDVCSNEPENCLHEHPEKGPWIAMSAEPDTCWNHTGAHHLDCVSFHSFLLREFIETHPGYDDRYIIHDPKH